jgi:lipopolysaccharide/colanic/teichoic acid biosynthesis glycosyltransferase
VLAELLRDDPQARAEWSRDQKLGRDPRITPVGEFLRRSSLDELPQLLNVLRGEMSLVGPRPITVAELTRYGSVRWDYLSVRPGITGLWQVSGRNNTTYEERVALDRRYVEQRSVLFDVAILFKTVRVVLLREGAR